MPTLRATFPSGTELQGALVREFRLAGELEPVLGGTLRSRLRRAT
jgi:hypothetical protein